MVCVGLGVLCVIALWWRHTETASLTGTTIGLAIGRLAGLLAAYGSMLLILMAARIDPLERRVGSRQLAHFHSGWGKATLVLVLVHVCAITLGYAGLVHLFPVAEAWILIEQYPYVWLALVGAALLALVAVVSVRAALRAVGYQTWYRVHLLTYAAVVLALGHQLAVGSDFVHDPLNRTAWIALYVVVGLAVVYYRLWRPALLAVRRRSRVVDVVPEGGAVVSIAVRNEGAVADAEPGQYFRVRFLARKLWSETHPFSVSSLPDGDTLRFTVKARGGHTARLQAVAPGTRVLLMGPHGGLTPASNRRDVLLIAAGIGITPIRPLFQALSESGLHVTLIYRCPLMDEVPFRGELDAVAERWGTSVVYLIGSRDDPANALDAAELVDLVPDVAQREIYVCAPSGLTERLVASLDKLGVPRARLHREEFGLDDLTATRGARVAAGAVLAVVLLALVALRAGPTRQPVPAAASTASDGANVLQLPTSGNPNAAGATVTVDGPVERTLFNNVQVRVVLRAGRLVSVSALMLPSIDARSRQLSALAGPILAQEALASNGAIVDAVSGASYTSGAYMESLQAALDRARGAGR